MITKYNKIVKKINKNSKREKHTSNKKILNKKNLYIDLKEVVKVYDK